MGNFSETLTTSEKAILKQRRFRDKGRAQPKLGVDHVSHMVNLAPLDAGLSYLHVLTEKPTNLPYTKPLQATVLAVAKSPIFIKTLEIVVDKVATGRRLLLMVEQPYYLSLLYASLLKARIRVVIISSATPPTERSLRADMFNDETSNVDVLVTSTAIASYGINFHRACSDGVLL